MQCLIAGACSAAGSMCAHCAAWQLCASSRLHVLLHRPSCQPAPRQNLRPGIRIVWLEPRRPAESLRVRGRSVVDTAGVGGWAGGQADGQARAVAAPRSSDSTDVSQPMPLPSKGTCSNNPRLHACPPPPAWPPPGAIDDGFGLLSPVKPVCACRRPGPWMTDSDPSHRLSRFSSSRRLPPHGTTDDGLGPLSPVKSGFFVEALAAGQGHGL